MIIERGQSTRKDAPPPPYIEVDDSTVDSPPSPLVQAPTHSKSPANVPDSPTTDSFHSPPSPPATSPSSHLDIPTSHLSSSSRTSLRSSTSVNTLAQALDSGKGKWFHTKKRTAKEVRAAVLQVLGNLVRNYGKHLHDPDAEPVESMLANCATACESASLSFTSLIQETSVEGHAPIYWAIVTHDADSDRHTPSRLISGILRHSLPLDETSRLEIRSSCLLTKNQALFDYIRCMEAYTPLPSGGIMLLGEDFRPDSITVEEPNSAGFTATFEIMKFMKRIHLSHEITLDFIAKARVWRLAFSSDSKHKTGSWQISLHLLELSPPTFADAELHVLDASPYPVVSSRSLSPTSGSTSKPLPDIVIVLSSQCELVPRGTKPSRGQKNAIEVPLNNPDSTSLLGEGSAYISVDETLRARLEMKLVKPDKESSCVIC